jgi:spore coat polysaccharide biosynthesis protein SpsF
MKTGIVIQARKGATRLPNKMVLPFYQDKGVLELLIKKIKKQYPNTIIVLATTDNKADDELEQIALENEIQCYRGDENNVLSRFIEVGEQYHLKNIIRVCADNPFLDVLHIQELTSKIEEGKYDYVSYKNNKGTPVIKTHLGLFTEAASLNALKSIAKNTDKKLYLEHVTNYLYTHDYEIKLLDLPEYFNNTDSIRLTLDTLEDFQLEKALYSKLKDASTKELIEYIKHDKNIIGKMKEQIIKNTK